MKKLFVLILLTASFGRMAIADEGMWLLPLIEQLNQGKIKSMGCKLSGAEIFNINQNSLKDAVVIFGGGCTGEIVSSEGLLLTNHHCGYDQIQAHSTVEHDYLKNGFWAMNRSQELPNPGLSVQFLERMENVTPQMLARLNPGMPESVRDSVIVHVADSIADAAVAGTKMRALVKDFFGGNEFYLIVYKVYRDVRLVGTPPSSIGKFGADTDNWMWPRHTGDFSVFRVYTAPDGSPAEYSPENIPLKPKRWLTTSLKGINKGDYTMILGFPGSTDRYLSSFGIKKLFEQEHPNRITIRGLRQDIWLKDMRADAAVNIKYASKYSRSSNYWKYSIGQNQGIKRLNLIARKQAIEQQFANWVAADEARQTEYGNVLAELQRAIEETRTATHALQYINEAIFGSIEIARLARQALPLYSELKKKNPDQSVINAEAKKLKLTAEKFYKDYYQPTDRTMTRAMLALFSANVPTGNQPEFLTRLNTKGKADYARYTDQLFNKSIFADSVKLNRYLAKPDFKTLKKDPAFDMAFTTLNTYYRLLKEAESQLDVTARNERLFIQGLRQMDVKLVQYPDANFSMRFTYGTVGDYSPRDAVNYSHYTTLKGVMEKEDPDNWEFVVPEKLKDLYYKGDYGRYGVNGELVTCFTTNNDITGGNSGSPVLNANGELIGLAFDGNWEAMSGDIAFENDLQKCIVADIRYVLFIMDKFAGAKHLVDEMTLVE